MAALVEHIAGVRLSVFGDGPGDAAECSIVICNHHCRLDWMFLWCLFARQRKLRSLKIALKAELKRAPFFGWAMQATHAHSTSRRTHSMRMHAAPKQRAFPFG